jgi:hypothetical protein
MKMHSIKIGISRALFFIIFGVCMPVIGILAMYVASWLLGHWILLYLKVPMMYWHRIREDAGFRQPEGPLESWIDLWIGLIFWPAVYGDIAQHVSTR